MSDKCRAGHCWHDTGERDSKNMGACRQICCWCGERRTVYTVSWDLRHGRFNPDDPASVGEYMGAESMKVFRDALQGGDA